MFIVMPLAFGRKPIHEQGEIEFPALRADFLRVGLERREVDPRRSSWSRTAG